MAYNNNCNCEECRSTREWHRELSYRYGFYKPRYPMPAIPIEAGFDFDGGFVGVCVIERPYSEDYRIVFDLWNDNEKFEAMQRAYDTYY